MDTFLYQFSSRPTPSNAGVHDSSKRVLEAKDCSTRNFRRIRAKEPCLFSDFVKNRGRPISEQTCEKKEINKTTKKCNLSESFAKDNLHNFGHPCGPRTDQYMYFSKPAVINHVNHQKVCRDISNVTRSTNVNKICRRGFLPNVFAHTIEANVQCNNLQFDKWNTDSKNSKTEETTSLTISSCISCPAVAAEQDETHKLMKPGHAAEGISDASLFASFVRQKEEEEEQTLQLYKEFLEKRAYEEDSSIFSDDNEVCDTSARKCDSFSVLHHELFPYESVLNFSNPDELADVLSPPTTLRGVLPKPETVPEDCLKLVFDADFNEYFDPASGKYYRLE